MHTYNKYNEKETSTDQLNPAQMEKYFARKDMKLHNTDMARKKAKLVDLPGRAKITIDWDMVDKLLMAQCTGAEIAAHFGFCADTLYDRTVQDKGVTFSDYSLSKRNKGKSLLRTKQVQKALEGKGDNTMLVWLGKQYLEQKDQPTKEQQFDGGLIKLLDILKTVDPDNITNKEEKKDA